MRGSSVLGFRHFGTCAKVSGHLDASANRFGDSPLWPWIMCWMGARSSNEQKNFCGGVPELFLKSLFKCWFLTYNKHYFTPVASFPKKVEHWTEYGRWVEHSNSGKKVSIQFDSILAAESIFFDSIRFANLINLPLLHWYSNSNGGEFGEGPGGVSLRCGSFGAISVSIRQFPTS